MARRAVEPGTVGSERKSISPISSIGRTAQADCNRRAPRPVSGDCAEIADYAESTDNASKKPIRSVRLEDWRVD